MATQSEIVERIKALIGASGQTHAAVGARAGLSAPQMSRLLSNDRKLSATELALLAEALGVRVGRLLGEDDEAPLPVAARAGHDVVDVKPALVRAEALWSVRHTLDRFMTRPSAPRPELALPARGHMKSAGQDLAHRMRAVLGLDEIEPISSIEDVAERFGLDVSVEPLPERVHGLVMCGNGDSAGSAIAVVNGRDTAARRRFTIAHELCHALYRDGDGRAFVADVVDADTSEPKDWRKELRADTFAAYFLAPAEGLRALAIRLQEGAETGAAEPAVLVGHAAVTYGVSIEAARNRLDTEEIVSKDLTLGLTAGDILSRAGLRGRAAQILGTSDEVAPPRALLAQALVGWQERAVTVEPLAALYDESVEATERSLQEAGWVMNA